MSLIFSNITHHYRQNARSQWQLSVESLTVEAGEIVCLFGPSGCGKTSLLRLAAGLEQVQSGEITLNGTMVAGPNVHTPPEDRSIGFVFQDYVLFPHLTVFDNVLFGLNALPKREARDIAAKQLDAMQLAQFGNRYPHQLSGGQQQRVAIARALARNPAALMLDEPFASIGATLRAELQRDIRQVLKSNDVAALFVTHDADEALMMGDRIVVMDQGKILDIGSAQDLYEAPKDLGSALLFRDHVRLDASLQHGTIKTPFGDCPCPVQFSGNADGPVQLALKENAISATPNPDGHIRVTDIHFTPRGYKLHLSDSKSQASTTILHPTFLPVGTSLETHIHADGIHFVTSGASK